jgi:hypothetical protein
MLDAAWTWFVATLRAYPELMVFLALALGHLIGPLKLKGFALGTVTATLLAAILIGQLGIKVEGPLKATFFLLFLFAVGYGVGPQFFQGISKDGPKQIVFSRDCARTVSARSRRVRVDRRTAGRLRGGAVCGLADDLGSDRRRVGPDRTTWPDRG